MLSRSRKRQLAPGHEIRTHLDRIFQLQPGDGVAGEKGLVFLEPTAALSIAQPKDQAHRGGATAAKLVDSEVLNEVVIAKGALAPMAELEVTAGESRLKFTADNPFVVVIRHTANTIDEVYHLPVEIVHVSCTDSFPPDSVHRATFAFAAESTCTPGAIAPPRSSQE